jgi:hypothetical protein
MIRPKRRVLPFLAAIAVAVVLIGAACSMYTESWAGIGESVSGSAWGPVVNADFAFVISRHFAVIGRVEWSRLSAGQGSLASPSVQLGGTDVLGGIAVRF